MANQNQNGRLLVDGYYLTDGGLETTLIFHQGIELNHFAAFELLQSSSGRQALRDYYQPYLQIAQQYDLPFVLETPTWRANPDWAYKLGYSNEELTAINRQAVTFIRELVQTSWHETRHVLLSGNIGPRGDGYRAEHVMRPEEAKAYHLPQIRTFAEAGVDVVTAVTLNYSAEAVGIVLAAREVGVPVVISFTVETDGKLPNGETLREAIEKTDGLTDGYAAYFMINCAHPEHFKAVLHDEGGWKERIRGIRANASIRSQAELDEAETLDTGDKQLLANGYCELQRLLPKLQVIGGCCGTDHSHLDLICQTLLVS